MIDFHSHLDLYPNPNQVAQECVTRGIYVLSVTTTPSAWEGTTDLTRGAVRIRTALGLHPQLAHERKGELVLFERILSETRYVGEIGLDGSTEFKKHWSDQMAVFVNILKMCAKAGGRVLSIHSRRAATSVLDILKAYPDAGTPILHWFSGSQRELVRAIELGCWFSVGPAMLISERGRDLIRNMPRDRILTESDGPFVQIEGRSIFPWDSERAVIGMAALWGETLQYVDKQLFRNFEVLVEKFNPEK